MVTLATVLHDNGPYGPVEIEVQRWATAPQDCTVEVTETDVKQSVLPNSVDVVLDEEFIVHCDVCSRHVFYFDNQIIRIKNPGVIDPDLGNNFASTQLAVNVWAQADLEMVDQQVFECDDLDADTVCDVGEPLLDAPAQVTVGEDVPIVVWTVIQNGGPFALVDVEAETIAMELTGCHVTPPSHLERIRDLPAGVSIIVKAPFTIRCDGPIQHTFGFDNAIRVNQQHVRDPNAGNDTVHTELTVTAS